MKVFSEVTPLKSEDLFIVLDSINKGFDYPLHHHRECELNLVLGSSGNRIVGDSYEKYHQSDLVLVGPYVTHKWDDADKTADPPSDCRVITLQFDMGSFDRSVLSKKPFVQIQSLLGRAQRGIVFSGHTRQLAMEILKRLSVKKDFEAVLDFLNLLHILSISTSCRYLTSIGFEPGALPSHSDRFMQAHQYILRHFQQPDLRLEQVAKYVSMSCSAFSHFFKKYTNRSFSDFLIKMRLGHASKLLLDTDDLIGDIAFTSGYNNLANFNRQFKKYYGCSPSHFRIRYQKSVAFDNDREITPGQFVLNQQNDSPISKDVGLDYHTKLIHY